MKMTVEELIAAVTTEIVQPCLIDNAELVRQAAQGCVNLINSTGWLAVPQTEGIEIFKAACVDYMARRNL